MIRIVCALLGFVLCLIGLVGLLTPIPFGVVFLLLGMMLLIPAVPQAAHPVRYIRRKVPLFDRMMYRMTHRAPIPYKRVLRKTEIDSIHF